MLPLHLPVFFADVGRRVTTICSSLMALDINSLKNDVSAKIWVDGRFSDNALIRRKDQFNLSHNREM